MNILLKEFSVHSHQELFEYIKRNPHDERAQQIKEILQMFLIDVDKQGDNNGA